MVVGKVYLRWQQPASKAYCSSIACAWPFCLTSPVRHQQETLNKCEITCSLGYFRVFYTYRHTRTCPIREMWTDYGWIIKYTDQICLAGWYIIVSAWANAMCVMCSSRKAFHRYRHLTETVIASTSAWWSSHTTHTKQLYSIVRNTRYAIVCM